jgi:ABC-2 type transport system permease protein
MGRNIFKYKDLLFELIKREIKARYKQSILGYAWVILVPLVNLLVLSVVFSFFVRIPTGNVPYSIYLFAGLVPWLFTANAITSATTSVVGNASLITKIALPRQIFPTSSVFSKVIDFCLNFLIMLVFMIFFRIPLGWTLLLVPFIFFFQFLLVLGIGNILSSINVYFRDVENVIGVFLSMWMYLTPVLYPPEIVPESARLIFNLNPMTPLINSYRNIILYQVFPPWQSFAYSAVVSLVTYILGLTIFKKLSKNFADVI